MLPSATFQFAPAQGVQRQKEREREREREMEWEIAVGALDAAQEQPATEVSKEEEDTCME
jgi:hypothetical protein